MARVQTPKRSSMRLRPACSSKSTLAAAPSCLPAQAPDCACIGSRRLERLEERLYSGPVAERNVSDAVLGLRLLANAVPATAASLPSVQHASPDLAVGSNALFILAALSASGVLSPEVLPWDEGYAASAFAHAASSANRDAFLALGNRLVHGQGHGQGDCNAGLPWLRTAADEALASAESAAHHTVPKEPLRLRDRLRDGSWKPEAGDDESDQHLQMEEDLAARGVPEAQRHLGYRQLLGRGVPADAAAAAAAFAEAAAAGDEYAQFNLGFLKMRGLDGDKNYTLARLLFEASAAQELPAAFNGLGVLHFNGWGMPRNYTAAKLAFEAGAERGDPDAHYNLGMLFLGGYGVDADATTALVSFEAASEAGHWRAPHTLASLHADGNGTVQNCSRAARLFTLFVEERLDWAGWVDDAIKAYDSGDVQGALVQLSLLAAMGCEAAANNIAFILRAGKADWLTKTQAVGRARVLLEFAAARGAADARVELGDLALAEGDAATALKQYSLAAEHGVAEGMFSLGMMHVRGLAEGGGRNLSAAIQHMRAAWDAAPTDEAVIPPALALAALHVWTRTEHLIAPLASLTSAQAEGVAVAVLTFALGLVMQRRLQLRAPLALH